MSSAAKLRKYGRGTATIATAALVMTSFGPTAFAFTPLPDTDSTTPGVQVATTSNQAGAASVGLVDTDGSKTGTQGATAVAAGGVGQTMADVRFVVPATFEAGDTYDFQIGAASPASAADRVSFSGTPAVSFDSQAYDEKTHVGDSSPATGAAAGATEGGALAKYVKQGTETDPKAPEFDVALVSSGGNNYQNIVRITFKNNSDPAASRAKFVGTIKGAKIDVGTAVTGAIALKASGADSASNGLGTAPSFLSDVAPTVRDTTYPAAVTLASLDVQGGSVVADGSDQNVGPITVTAAQGQTFGASAVTVTLSGGTFTANTVTATAYNAAGTPVPGGTVTQTGTTVTFTPASAGTVSKIVFGNTMVKAPTSATALDYSLTSTGGLAAPTTPLGGAAAPTHQVDIEAPKNQTITTAVASSLPDRLGGLDRYQTAVKIAERALGTDTKGPKGESDNVIIASGEAFPDALSSGYLAATKKAQLILTRQGSLPQTDIEFLKTYGAKNIFIVGGEGAVGKAVEEQLRNLQSFDVQAKAQTQQVTKTVNGGSLPATATAGGQTATLSPQLTYANQASAPGNLALVVARDGSGNATNITTGSPGYAVSGYSGTTATVTLTLADGTTKVSTVTVGNGSTTTGANDTYNYTVANTTSQVTTTEAVPGGPTDQTAQGTDRMVVPLQSNLTVIRLAGADRFATNRRVNEYAGATSASPIGTTVPEYGKATKKTAILANGMTPWDALAAGPLVGNGAGNPIPVILTAGSSLNGNAKAQMQNLDIEAALMIGGSGVLPDSLMGEMNGLGVWSNRLAGADRWITAKAVGEYALKSATASATNPNPGMGFGTHAPILANGGSMNGSYTANNAANAWADALAAGPFAAAQDKVIALTDSRSIPGATKALLSANKSKFLVSVIAVGLGDVVSTETVKQANDAITQ